MLSTYATIIQAETGLVGYWPLNETSGTTAFDQSGNGLNGTITGTVTLNQQALLAADSTPSMLFSGSSAYVTLPTSTLPTGNTPWSLEIWCLPTNSTNTTTGHMLTIGAPGTTSEAGYIAQTSGGAWLMGSWSNDLTATGTTFGGMPYHVVGTYDGTTMIIYVNGVVITSGSKGPLSLIESNPTIGTAYSSGSIRQFLGYLGHAAIYSVALSAAKVKAHYAAGINASSLVNPIETVGPGSQYLAILGGSANGSASITAKVQFTDGTEQDITLGLTDWANTTASFSNFKAVTMTYRDNNTTPFTSGTALSVFLWLATATLPAGKVVRGVTFATPGSGQMHIFAWSTADISPTSIQTNSAGIQHDRTSGNANSTANFDAATPGHNYSYEALSGQSVTPGKLLSYTTGGTTYQFSWPNLTWPAVTDSTSTTLDNYQVDSRQLIMPPSTRTIIDSFVLNTWAFTDTLSPTDGFLVTPPSSYALMVLAETSLVSYWPLNETSGTTALDWSGNNHQGTITGAVSLNQTGLLTANSTKSMSFSANSQYIALPTSGIPTGNNQWAIEAWAKPTAAFQAGHGHLITIGTQNLKQAGFSAQNTTPGGWNMGAWSDDFTGFAATVGGTIYHVVVTYDGASTMRMYVNGVFQGSGAAGTLNVTAASNAYIGVSGPAANNFVGAIAHVAVYNVALSAARIALHYQAGTNTCWFDATEIVTSTDSFGWSVTTQLVDVAEPIDALSWGTTLPTWMYVDDVFLIETFTYQANDTLSDPSLALAADLPSLSAVQLPATETVMGAEAWGWVIAFPGANLGFSELNVAPVDGDTFVQNWQPLEQVTATDTPSLAITSSLVESTAAPSDSQGLNKAWVAAAAQSMTLYFGATVSAPDLTSASTLFVANTTTSAWAYATNPAQTNSNVWSEIYANGTANTWENLTNPGSPSGHGWLWDNPTLQNNSIVAGNWIVTTRIQSFTFSLTANVLVRFYKWNSQANTYAIIGSTQLNNATTTIYNFGTAFTLPTVSLATMSFGPNDYLYADMWVQTNTSNLSSAVYFAGVTGTSGNAGAQLVLPGIAYVDIVTEAEAITDAAFGAWEDDSIVVDAAPFLLPVTNSWNLVDAVTEQDCDATHWASATLAVEDDLAAPVDTVTRLATFAVPSDANNASDLLAVLLGWAPAAETTTSTDLLAVLLGWTPVAETTTPADVVAQAGAVMAPLETANVGDASDNAVAQAWVADVLSATVTQALTLGTSWGTDLLALLADRQDSAANWVSLDSVTPLDTTAAAAAASFLDLLPAMTETGPWPTSQGTLWALLDTVEATESNAAVALLTWPAVASVAVDVQGWLGVSAVGDLLSPPLDAVSTGATLAMSESGATLDLVALLAQATIHDDSLTSVAAMLNNATLGLGDALPLTPDTLDWHNPFVYLTGTDLSTTADALGSAAALLATEILATAADVTWGAATTLTEESAPPADATNLAARQDIIQSTTNDDAVLWADATQWSGAQLAGDMFAAAALSAVADVVLSLSGGAWIATLTIGDGSTLADILALAAALQSQDATAPSDTTGAVAVTNLADAVSLADQAAQLLTLFAGDAVAVSDATAAAATGLWLERATTDDGVALYAWLLWFDVEPEPNDGASYRLTPLLIMQTVALARDGRMSAVGRDGAEDARARDGRQAAQEE